MHRERCSFPSLYMSIWNIAHFRLQDFFDVGAGAAQPPWLRMHHQVNRVGVWYIYGLAAGYKSSYNGFSPRKRSRPRDALPSESLSSWREENSSTLGRVCMARGCNFMQNRVSINTKARGITESEPRKSTIMLSWASRARQHRCGGAREEKVRSPRGVFPCADLHLFLSLSSARIYRIFM